MRLLIVDDSVVFRSQIKAAVESSLNITTVATAANGKIAIQKLQQDKFDVMTLDMEMPEMNGMETLREIRDLGLSIKVVVFAAQTTRGASSALEALKLGALEVVCKPDGGASSLDQALAQVKDQLLPILREVELGHVTSSQVESESVISPPEPSKNLTNFFPQIISAEYPKIRVESFRPKLVVIGSSTGGPNALETIFSAVQAPTKIPIMIVQHMPPVFTASLASRLESITGVKSAEGKNGEVIGPGRIYVAPGDFHMGLYISPSGICIKLGQSPKRCNVRPAVDVLFEDAASIFEQHVGAFVLTGMGEDGMLGTRAIKTKGGAVAIQDRESSVVWGMPGSVHAAGSFDRVMSLQDCGRLLNEWVRS